MLRLICCFHRIQTLISRPQEATASRGETASPVSFGERIASRFVTLSLFRQFHTSLLLCVTVCSTVFPTSPPCSTATTSASPLAVVECPTGHEWEGTLRLRTTREGKPPAESGIFMRRVSIPAQKQQALSSTSEARARSLRVKRP